MKLLLVLSCVAIMVCGKGNTMDVNDVDCDYLNKSNGVETDVLTIPTGSCDYLVDFTTPVPTASLNAESANIVDVSDNIDDVIEFVECDYHTNLIEEYCVQENRTTVGRADY